MVALTGSLHRPLSPRVLTKRSQQEGLIETGRNTGHRAADGIRLIFGKRTRCTIARLRGCAVARLRGSVPHRRHQMLLIFSSAAPYT